MYILRTPILFALCCFGFLALGQPPVCSNNNMASTCAAACIVCDLDGFASFNEGAGGGQLPPGYCTQVLHHAEWIGFIAGSTNLSFQLSVSNCSANPGLEAGIYEGIDCQNFSLISNCETAIFNNTTVTMTTNVPLVIGQYYWLVMDSNGGPACDFSINVTAGSTVVPPPSAIPAINGPTAICPGLTVNYSILPVTGAPNVSWEVNGQSVGSGLSLNYQFPSAGNYQVCVEASNPCNPPVSLCTTVVVANIPPTAVTEIICLGDCFQAPDGSQLCSPGFFPITLDSWQGCDSVVNYTIQVIQPPTTVLSMTICEGEWVMIGPESFSSPGTYNVVLSNWQGCDSIVVLNLENYPPIVENYSVSICEGETYVFGNVVYNQTGMYQQVFSNWLGCDSTINLDLTVMGEDSVFISQTICQGESYQVGNQSFTVTGNYSVLLENAAGCDSTVLLDLDVNLNPVTNLSAQICQGQTYAVGTQTFSSSGNYQVVLTSSTGCDSTVNLALSVVQALATTLNQQICQGQSFQVGAQVFSQTGTYSVTLTSVAGCDSVVTLNLQVLSSLQTNLDVQICQGESYQVGGQSFSQTGQYQVVLTSVAGCDSIVQLDLAVPTNPTTVLNEAVCQGQTVQVGGQVFGQTGNYQVVLSSASGCDSTVILNLDVQPNPSTSLTRSICQGSSYAVGNQSFTQSGVYQITLSSYTGCDSTVILDLSVLTSLQTNLQEQVCTGQSVAVGNQTFNQTGTYTVLLSSVAGCDSTVTLDLSVLTSFQTDLQEQVCTGQSVAVGSQTFSQTGTYTVLLSSVAGCDSTVTLDLTVSPQIVTPLAETVCAGGSVAVGNQVFNQTGQHQVLFTSTGGCDSLVLLDLTVLPPILTPLSVNICTGQNYSVGGQTFSQAGQYSVPLTSFAGCDSTVNLNLTFSDFLETFLNEQICEGTNYQVGNQSFQQTGSYQVAFVTNGGCDSVVYLDLNVLPNPTTNLSATICEGESYPIGNQVFSLSGNYSVVLSSAQGCDSTVNLALTVTPVATSNLTAQICEGDVYTVGNQQFTQTGAYQVVLQATSNCDSIVHLNLSVTNCGVVASLAASPVNCNGGSDGSLAFTINDGTPPFSYDWGGAGLPSGNGTVAALGTQTILPDLPAGTYTVTITGADGFAGTFSATVTQPSALVGGLVASQIGNYNLGCHGDQNGSVSCNTSGGTPPYQFAWDTGQSSPVLTGLPAGSYALTVMDAHGCQLELLANLLEPPAIAWEIETTEPTCTEPLGSLSVAAMSGGVGPYQFALDGGGFAPQNSFEGLATGSYTLVGQDANGCQLAATVSLQGFEEVQVSLGADLIVELGEAVTLVPVSNASNPMYAWQGERLSCTDCERPKVQPLADGVYTLTVTTPDGCSATDELTIHVLKNRSIYVPNAFSPNDDGINDVLMVFAGPDVAKVRGFQVYSRWGESVFTYFNIPPNEVAYGWDGRYRGKEMQPAVFTWFAEVEFLDGEVTLFKGDAAIVR